MRTKWDVLVERESIAFDNWQRAKREIDSLIKTALDLKCAGCGVQLNSEAEFAKHFRIPDERYLNLGECPDKV